jgi:hypothetical protein
VARNWILFPEQAGSIRPYRKPSRQKKCTDSAKELVCKGVGKSPTGQRLEFLT